MVNASARGRLAAVRPVEDQLRLDLQPRLSAEPRLEQHEADGARRAVADESEPLRLQPRRAQKDHQIGQPLRLVDQIQPPAPAQRPRRCGAQRVERAAELAARERKAVFLPQPPAARRIIRRSGDGKIKAPGRDLRVRLPISFEEAVHGCKKNITITRQQECTECHGTGCAAGTSPETCPDCGGRGFVIRQQRTPFGVMQTQQPCSRCGGRGKLVKNPCKVCHGSGRVAAQKTMEVSVPAGIDDDQSLALRGKGDAGSNGGPAGDVIVMVTVRPSEVFQRDGYDVWVTVPITYSQAVLGDEIQVPSIDGKVEYTVPEGTQSGTTFRLRGKGIQYLNGRGRGDMYVKCEVEIPKKLNKTQREALKKFEGTLKEENYEKRKGFFKKLKDMFNS